MWGRGVWEARTESERLGCQSHLMCREGIRISVMQDGGDAMR